MVTVDDVEKEKQNEWDEEKHGPYFHLNKNKYPKNMNSTITLAHESKLSGKLNDVMYLLKCADEERVRGQAYIISTQGCVERILDDIVAAEFVEELAYQENDSTAKNTFLSQAAICHSEATANMKNVFDTVYHIIEMSEINAALKISIVEEKKDAAFDQYNKAEATLKNMNHGAGRLYDSAYKLL